jgi:hypothetical protein
MTMRKHRGDLRSILMMSALAISLGAGGAQAASLMKGPAASDVQPKLQRAVSDDTPRVILASATGAEADNGNGGEAAGDKSKGKGAEAAADAADNAQDAPGREAAGELAGDDDAASPGASEAAADSDAIDSEAEATEADAAAADAEPAADESSAVTEGASASADSTADASVGTADGIAAEAGAAASAEAVNGDAGPSVSTTADADASVAVESDQPHTAKTKSTSKSVTTKFGSLSIARTTTHVVLDDGTRVRASAHARALALATPGVTKADSTTRASVDIHDGAAAEASAIEDGAAASTGGASATWNDPAAISEANAR